MDIRGIRMGNGPSNRISAPGEEADEMTLTPVLMYHAIGRPLDARFRRWVIPPSLLAEHLALLCESGYELIGLSEWARQPTGRKCVVLTFDDGYADFLEHAVPLLTAFQARATAYIVTGYVGSQALWLPYNLERRRPIMTWADLRTAASCGVEIGSHGHRHIELDTVPPPTAEADVQASHAMLTEHGLRPESFCYPFGYTNRTVRDIVMRAGFSNACVVGRGLADPGQDLLRVRRLAIDSRTSTEVLRDRLHGPAVFPGARLREASQPAWRLARRLRSTAHRPVKAEVGG
jgi:peptidoglycan/xylan/chitin deacetylase (PgdA/CDA1 family)